MVKEVFLVFKTHLDIGYTDYAAAIKERYLKEYLPAAVRVARESEGSECPFVWTTGAWLIEEALKQDDGTLDAAIRDGLVTWHAMPFTVHTEYMNPALLEACLDVSKRLDERYGRKTISAKMTDVPGHTAGIVPLLAARGVELLHIGVNPGTPVPKVPEIFRWRHDGAEIAVIYSGEYGGVCEVGEVALAFGFTGDNCGPQGRDQLRAVYQNLRERYPGAAVRAATLDDMARVLRGAELPVVEGEIGDSWIYGAASDPKKTSAFRHILRTVPSFAGKELNDSLLLVPEHTWGMSHVFFDRENKTDWTPDELEACGTRGTIERSWEEQREYVIRAAEQLGVDLSDAVTVEKPDPAAMTPFDGTPRAEVSYELFTWADYERYFHAYVRDNNTGSFLKVGMPSVPGGIYEPRVTGAWRDGETSVFRLEFDKEIRDFCGLPELWLLERADYVELRWFGKRANRLPEAFWLRLPEVTDHVELFKLGYWIDPERSVYMKTLHGMRAARGPEYEIESLDAPLAAPYGRRLLTWNEPLGEQTLYFNLYNNVWNTNFPLWYSDDAKFRFRISRRGE